MKFFIKKLFFLLLILPIAVFSQENISNLMVIEEPSFPVFGGGSAPEGTENCFDYYEFGSVDVQLNLGGSNNLYSGTEAMFRGTITNNNNYPIVSGSVYAKIFRYSTEDDTEIHLNGYALVDHFFVKKDINIDANETIPLEFSWNVPLYAIPDKYYIATYFIVDDKFNISGLSFTDDIIGNRYDFEISSEIKNGVYFDKNTVKINGKPHFFVKPIPSFTKDEPIVINIDIVNESNENKELDIPIIFKLYSWDGLQEENLISKENRSIILKPRERRTIDYYITETQKPVYFLVVESSYFDSKSILNIRFGRKDINNTRLNFVGPTTFPLKKGEPFSVYACMHGAGYTDIVKDSHLLLEVKDSKDKIIDTYEYKGDVSGAIMAVKKEIIPNNNFDKFKISAKLYMSDVLTDSTELIYDCSLINDELCRKSNLYFYLLLVFILLIFIILTPYILKRKKLLIVILFVFGINLLFTSVSEAKSVTWNKTYNKTLLFYQAPESPNLSTGALDNFNISVVYYVKVINLETNQEIKDDDKVKVGAKLSFDFIPYKDTDITWFGNGFVADSPYGHWVKDASSGNNNCSTDDYITTMNFGFATFKAYIPLNVNPPNKKITQIGTAKLDCNSDNSICTVISGGTIVPSFEFASTHGKFYYAYTDTRKSGCFQSYKNSALKKVVDMDYYNKFYQMDYIQAHSSSASGKYITCCNKDLANSLSLGCSYYPTDCGVVLSTQDFLVNIPSQTISYSLTAISPGKPPTTPVINLVEGQKNIKENLKFSFVSTDPENNQIKYLIDWDTDDGVDTINTTTGFYNSGVPGYATKLWLTGGNKRIKAKAQDSDGNTSDWGYYSFSIDPCVTYQNNPCSVSNICGTNTGKYLCDGSCSVSAPTIPPNYGSTCTAKNMCNMENKNAKIQCDGKCGPAPSDSLCLIDSGVRINQGTPAKPDIVKIAADPTLNSKSPVRVMTKDGVRSIPVTSNFNDPMATKIRIITKDGVRALLKYISN